MTVQVLLGKLGKYLTPARRGLGLFQRWSCRQPSTEAIHRSDGGRRE